MLFIMRRGKLRRRKAEGCRKKDELRITLADYVRIMGENIWGIFVDGGGAGGAEDACVGAAAGDADRS